MRAFKYLLAVFATTLALAACTTPPSAPAASGNVAEAAEKLRLLMIDPDASGLAILVSDKLSYGHSGGRVDTKTSFIADLLSGASDFVTIEISDQSVVVEQNVALIRHTLTATTNDKGTPGTVKLKVLQVWQQSGSGWVLLARQAVRAAP